MTRRTKTRCLLASVAKCSLMNLFLMLVIINVVAAVFVIIAAFLAVAKVHPAVVFFGDAAHRAGMNRWSVGDFFKEFFSIIMDLSFEFEGLNNLFSKKDEVIGDSD